MNENNSFVVYESFSDALNDLNDAQFRACVEALFAYGLKGEDISEDFITKMYMTLVKPQIDANAKRREAGKRGGRPVKAESKTEEPTETISEVETTGCVEDNAIDDTKTNGYEPLENQKPMVSEVKTYGYEPFTNAKPNVNVNVNANVNVNGNEEKEEKEKDTPPAVARTRFRKPTLSELEEVAKARGYTWSCQEFFDYYEANGWKVGKNPMKDWKAAMANWDRHSVEFNYAQKPKKQMPEYLTNPTKEVAEKASNADIEAVQKLMQKMSDSTLEGLPF